MLWDSLRFEPRKYRAHPVKHFRLQLSDGASAGSAMQRFLPEKGTRPHNTLGGLTPAIYAGRTLLQAHPLVVGTENFAHGFGPRPTHSAT